MIDLTTCNEWQRRDADGRVFPWYVGDFLDELVTWDLKDKIVFEYGCGSSTLWWRSRCKEHHGVESNIEWAQAVGMVMYCPERIEYVSAIERTPAPDIVIVDGDPVEWRDDCVLAALQNIKTPGILICDNFQQPGVWMSKWAKELPSLKYTIYKQPGHQFWQTAIFYIQ
jgi:hypothetical protein